MAVVMAGLSGPVAADDCKVGIAMYTLNAPYFAAQVEAAADQAREAGCEVFTSDGQNDMGKQISDVEDWWPGASTS
jgi:ribose transport system substrate-binding protein